MTDRNELVARLRRVDEYEPLGHDGWEAADRIEADAATIARLEGERDAGAKDYCALMDRHDALFVRAEAAEANLARAVEGLRRIARQKRTDEHDEGEGDFEAGYDGIIDHARAIIAEIEGA